MATNTLAGLFKDRPPSSPGGLVVERLLHKKCHSATTNPIRYGVFMLQVSLVFHTIVPLIDLSNTA